MIAVIILLLSPNIFAQNSGTQEGREPGPRRQLRPAPAPSFDENPFQAEEPAQDPGPSTNFGIQGETPRPPYPNFPESRVPSPPRGPRQQEHFYFTHMIIEPSSIIGGSVAFSILPMVGRGVAIKFGMDIYLGGIDIYAIGATSKPEDNMSAFLIRFGVHIFPELTQLKGIDIGIDFLGGPGIVVTAGSAVILDFALELSLAYRLVIPLYTNTGSFATALGFAPYAALNFGTILNTAGSATDLANSNATFQAYLLGKHFVLGQYTHGPLGPLLMNFGFRIGFDISIVF